MIAKTTMNERPQMALHYIFDPLCGWCYGAAPLVEAARGVRGLRVLWHGGGMFTGANRRPVTPCLRAGLMASDLQIEQLTGQPFGQAYFDGLLRDPCAVLDSAPPTTAMLVLQALEGRGLDMLARLQHAHYFEGRRIADRGVLRDLAVEMGVRPCRFDVSYEQWRGARTQLHFDESLQWFMRVRGLGFPTFVLERGDGRLRMQDVSQWMAHPQAWSAHLQEELAGEWGPPAVGAHPATGT